jgi:hypothetical protein
MTAAERRLAEEALALTLQLQRRQRDPREILRACARICETTDPDRLAELASDIDGTLHTLARMSFWFKRYSRALRRRQPQ